MISEEECRVVLIAATVVRSEDKSRGEFLCQQNLESITSLFDYQSLCNRFNNNLTSKDMFLYLVKTAHKGLALQRMIQYYFTEVCTGGIKSFISHLRGLSEEKLVDFLRTLFKDHYSFLKLEQ